MLHPFLATWKCTPPPNFTRTRTKRNAIVHAHFHPEWQLQVHALNGHFKQRKRKSEHVLPNPETNLGCVCSRSASDVQALFILLDVCLWKFLVLQQLRSFWMQNRHLWRWKLSLAECCRCHGRRNLHEASVLGNVSFDNVYRSSRTKLLKCEIGLEVLFLFRVSVHIFQRRI